MLFRSYQHHFYISRVLYKADGLFHVAYKHPFRPEAIPQDLVYQLLFGLTTDKPDRLVCASVRSPFPFPAYATVEDNPPYKSVKDIYYEYFTELDEALNSFSDSAEPIFSDAGIDLVYKNDVSLWKKFGNSLRLRFAVRLSEVDREKCVAEANAALTSPCGLISSKADNAYMPPKADGSWGDRKSVV